jgi:hypothetical protein
MSEEPSNSVPNATTRAAMEEARAMQATAHLLRSPENARRLLASIEQIRAPGAAAMNDATSDLIAVTRRLDAMQNDQADLRRRMTRFPSGLASLRPESAPLKAV